MSDISSINDWEGELSGLRDSNAELMLEMPLKKNRAGGAGNFLGKASDGKQYWIKTLNNCQGEKVPITEQIVARAGSLINAPVCSVKTIEIPSALVGWEFCPTKKLESGIAHASLLVSNATEVRGKLQYRDRDDNSRRHAKILALYDWCWGGDPQGLIEASDDNKFYSHDHGWFFPPEGREWSKESLITNINNSHILNEVNNGIDSEAIREVSKALENVNREQIKSVLKAIPLSWPVTDSELETVGFFLEGRVLKVAERLKDRFGVSYEK